MAPGAPKNLQTALEKIANLETIVTVLQREALKAAEQHEIWTREFTNEIKALMQQMTKNETLLATFLENNRDSKKEQYRREQESKQRGDRIEKEVKEIRDIVVANKTVVGIFMKIWLFLLTAGNMASFFLHYNDKP